MATETVAPPPTNATAASDEQVENNVIEEVKTIEQKSVSPSKECEEEEKPKAEESPALSTSVSESQEKMDDTQIEPPVPKTDDNPVSNVSAEDNFKVTQVSTTEPDTSVPEPVADSSKSQPELQPEIESIGKQPREQQTVESVEKQAEEQPKEVDVPEDSVEATEKQEEQLASTPGNEPQTAIVNDIKPSEAESGKPEPVPEVDKKPQEQSLVTEQVEKECEGFESKESVEGETVKDAGRECERVELKESVEAETVKDAVTHSDKVEDVILKEEQTCKDEEPNPSASTDQVVSMNQEVQDDSKADGGESSLHGVTEEVCSKGEEQELSGVSVVEVLSKEAATESGKVDEENEAKNVKTEENVETSVVPELAQPVVNEVEDVISSKSTTDATEKSLEEENSCRDVELVAENKKEENKRDEIPASVETSKDGEVERIVDKATVSAVDKAVGKSQDSELEGKREETVKANADELEKEKEVEEVAKSDVQNLEPSSTNDDVTETSQDQPKEQVPAKPTQKQSNNIISKVKHSLVKAKKAIIGKSPGSKALSTDTKGDIKVK